MTLSNTKKYLWGIPKFFIWDLNTCPVQMGGIGMNLDINRFQFSAFGWYLNDIEDARC